MIGWGVLVWWADDKELYEGVVNAFDDASQRHRILYKDGEWEFIALGVEPSLICKAYN
jgi:hypothetical protein